MADGEGGGGVSAEPVPALPSRNVASFELARSIRDVDRGEWNALTGVATRGWDYLRAMEDVRLADIDRRYVLVRDDTGALVAHTYFYAITLPLEIVVRRDHPLARLTRAARRVLPRFLAPRVVGCGSATTLGHTFSFAPQLDAADRREVVRGVVEQLETFARGVRAAGVIVRDFHDDEPFRGALEEAGLTRVPNEDDTLLDIRWSSYGGYLASLKSHYRRLVEQQTAARERAGIRVEHVREWSEHAEAMSALFEATASRYTAGPLVGADYFRAMSGCDRMRAALFFDDGRLLRGFILYFLDDDALVPSYLGVDYDANTRGSLVFNAYFEVIRAAIEQRKPRMWFGRTAYAAKMRLGAEAVPLSMFIRLRSRLATRVAATLLRALMRGPELKRWSVFKR